MGFYVLFLLISIVLLIIFPAVAAVICRYVFGGERGKAIFITFVLQFLFYGVCSYIVWPSIPSAAAVIGIGVAIGILLVSGLFGLTLYPIVFLLINRPPRWELYLKRSLVIFAIVMLPLMWPHLITMTGLTSNVDLYGQVVDIDGQPVANASVELRNCEYFQENPLRTDRDGIFHVVATCNRMLIFDRIFNPATQTYCESRERTSGYLRLVRGDPDHSRLSEKGIHWEHRLRENPLQFVCIWHRPAGLSKYHVRSSMVIADGRPYHIAPIVKDRRKHLQLVEGSSANGLEFALFIDNPAGLVENEPNNGRLEVSFSDGGVQQPGNHYAVPADGYGDRAIAAIDLGSARQEVSFSFQGSNATYFGVIDVTISGRRSREFRKMKITVFMDRDGSRVILSHRTLREPSQIDDLPF